MDDGTKVGLSENVRGSFVWIVGHSYRDRIGPVAPLTSQFARYGLCETDFRHVAQRTHLYVVEAPKTGVRGGQVAGAAAWGRPATRRAAGRMPVGHVASREIVDRGFVPGGS
jgi:hypothetical protein